jgi:hypothetical protein
VHPAGAVRIRLWPQQFARGARGVMLTAGTLSPATMVPRHRDVASRSPIKKRQRADPVTDAHEQVPRLRGGLRTARVGHHAPDAPPPGRHLPDELTRTGGGGRSCPQGNKSPASRPSAGLRRNALQQVSTIRRGRPAPPGAPDPPHRRRAALRAGPAQRTGHPAVSPGRVLPSQPPHPAADARPGPRPARPARAGPPARAQPAVGPARPAQSGPGRPT